MICQVFGECKTDRYLAHISNSICGLLLSSDRSSSVSWEGKSLGISPSLAIENGRGG